MFSIRKHGFRLAVQSSSTVFSYMARKPSRASWFFPYHGGEFLGSLTNYFPICIRGVVFPTQECSFYLTRSFSTIAGTILVQAQDPAKVCDELENAMEEHSYIDMWKLYEQYSNMDEFPRKFIVNKLLKTCGESQEVELLEKAYAWVERALEEGRQNQLEYDTLLYLSLSLARGGFHVQAATIIRKLVEFEQYPPVAAWSAIVGHMSSSAAGSYLAAELILEIGYLFQDNRVDPRKKINARLIAMKPDTVVVNIALACCLLSGTTKKAEQILHMIPRVGVKADVNLLISMAHIYERNGRKGELCKLQRYIHDAHNLTDIQFRQFYNCLLLCHLKFGDLNSASSMVLEMLTKAKEARNSLASATIEMTVNGKMTSSTALPSKAGPSNENGNSSENSSSIKIPVVSFQDFIQDRNHIKLSAEARNKLDGMLHKLQAQVEMITTERGILQPTERIFVRLVRDFLEAGKTKDLAEFLIKAEKVDSPVSVDSSALVHVINTCISLGWLDQAHDLVDEMQLAGIRPSSSVYSSLLEAYCKANKGANITSLLREVRKAGVQLDASSYEALLESRVLKQDTSGALSLVKEMKNAKISRSIHQIKNVVNGEDWESGLMGKLLHEIKEGQKVDHGFHDWNHVIHFFCRKRLMGDAEKALKKMRTLGHSPDAQTYHSMVTGYAAIGGKYIEVTELWGEMKSEAYTTGMKFDQELLDSVLYTFVRGGFFSRANEVVEMMEQGNMFVDKYKFRTLFLKYHKTMCKGKAPKVLTESQVRKREAALCFKRWVGLF